MMTEAVAQAASGAVVLAGRFDAMERPALPSSREFLSFRLGGQDYGIAAGMVTELRGCRDLAVIDEAPDCVAGALDLRGTLVPVVELRRWFGLAPAAEDVFNVAVILELGGRLFGLMVDSVSDVLRFTRRQIRPVPEAGADGAGKPGPKAQYVTGIGVDDERRLILLDIEKLMLGEGMGLLEVEAY